MTAVRRPATATRWLSTFGLLALFLLIAACVSQGDLGRPTPVGAAGAEAAVVEILASATMTGTTANAPGSRPEPSIAVSNTAAATAEAPSALSTTPVTLLPTANAPTYVTIPAVAASVTATEPVSTAAPFEPDSPRQRLAPALAAPAYYSDGLPPVAITYMFADGAGPSEADEYVALINVSPVSVDLMGWTLRDIADGRPSFVFPSVPIRPWQEVRVYTNEVHAVWGGFTFNSGTAIWSNCEPDVAGLLGTDGVLVTQATYPPSETC